MSNYVKLTNFAVKDNLPSGNANKLTKGSEVDAEFNAIQQSIATKYDSGNLATTAQAQAGTNGSVLMSPLTTASYVTGKIATSDEALAGSSNTTLITPQTLSLVLADAGLAPGGGSNPTFGNVTADNLTLNQNLTVGGDMSVDDIAANTVTLTGFLDGNVQGTLTGNVTGNLTGNVTSTGANAMRQLTIDQTTATTAGLILQQNNTGQEIPILRIQDSGNGDANLMGIFSNNSDNVIFRGTSGGDLFTIDNSDAVAPHIQFNIPPSVENFGQAGFQALKGIDGLEINPVATAPFARIKISAGVCMSEDNRRLIMNTRPFIKRFDLTLSQYDNATTDHVSGGFSTVAGARATDTWYSVYIGTDDDQTIVDAVILAGSGTSANAVTALSGLWGGKSWTQGLVRRIGYIRSAPTDNTQFLPFYQMGDHFQCYHRSGRIGDGATDNNYQVSAATLTNTNNGDHYTPSVFYPRDTVGHFTLETSSNATGEDKYLLVYPAEWGATTPGANRHTVNMNNSSAARRQDLWVPINSSREIRISYTSASTQQFTYTLQASGNWIDRRGRN